MTEQDLQTIEARRNAQLPEDVVALVAEVRRLQAIVIAVVPALSDAILRIEDGEGGDAQDFRDVLARLNVPTPKNA